VTVPKDSPRLTIAIPIHQAARWITGIVENVSRAPTWSRVVISDASGLDDSAARLKELLAESPNVRVVTRNQRLDWVTHCNLLLEEAETDFFCWLPQDDILMSDDFFEQLVGAFHERPELAVAVPAVFSVHGRGRLRRRPEFLFRRRRVTKARQDGGGVDFAVASANSDAPGSLGLIWKGVFRRSLARPMPTVSHGTSSDIAWAFSMAIAGEIVEVPEAGYLKRQHRQSATYLTDRTTDFELLELLLAEVSARFPDDVEARARASQSAGQVASSVATGWSSMPGSFRKVLNRLANKPRPFFE
jgi:hypothetical protein